MIVVGGFNTAIDKWARAEGSLEGLVPLTPLRLSHVKAWPGGKGLHVALAAATLGEPVCLVGLVDQARERSLPAFLDERRVAFDGVAVAGELRTCYAIEYPDGRVIELLEPGPAVAASTCATLLDRFVGAASEADVAVLSGSLPPGCPSSVYATAVARLRGTRTPVLIDTSGQALVDALDAGPSVVKVNQVEAQEVLGARIDDVAGAVQAGRALCARGALVAVVTLGADGLVACVEGQAYHASVGGLDVRNPVGAGDCVLGGLAAGRVRRLGLDDWLRLAAACGAAKTLHPDTGDLRLTDVTRLMTEVAIRQVP